MQEGQQGGFFLGLFFIGHGCGWHKEQVLLGIFGIRQNDAVFIRLCIFQSLIFRSLKLLAFGIVLQELGRQFLPTFQGRFAHSCCFGTLVDRRRLSRSTLLLVPLATPGLGFGIPFVACMFRKKEYETRENLMMMAVVGQSV